MRTFLIVFFIILAVSVSLKPAEYYLEKKWIYPEIRWIGRCVTQGNTAISMHGESFVLAGEEPSQLLFLPVASENVVLRSTYDPDQPDTIVYRAGQDYILNSSEGHIRRTPNSRIPDYSQHPWYGKTGFAKHLDSLVSNKPYFVYLDYRTEKGCDLSAPVLEGPDQRRVLSKFTDNATFSIVVYGDSICFGAEASKPELNFVARWMTSLKSRYPKTVFQCHNVSRSGMNSADGVASLSAEVLNLAPDLVLIGFGMNDYNTPLEDFKRNLQTMGLEISQISGAEIIFLSAFPANPDWYHFKANRRMPELARATREVAHELRAGYAGVFETWEKVLSRKDFPSLLMNDLNHPNDFGHWLYFIACNSFSWMPN